MPSRVCLFAFALSLFACRDAGAQLLFSNYASAVGVVSNDVLVGEPNSRYREGIVYVYRKTGGNWAESARIVSPSSANYDGFGHALSASGDDLLVAAPRDGMGRAHLFHRDAAGTWSYVSSIEEGGMSVEDGFAEAVALSGNLAAVGAPGKVQFGPPGHPQKTGTVFVYRRNEAGKWTKEAALTAGDAANASAFGHAVQIVDGMIVVGAPGVNEHTGAAYVFGGDAGTWTELAALTPSSGGEGSEFGASLAILGDRVLVGAPGADHSGMVVAFRQGENGWSEDRTLHPFDGQTRSAYGADIATGGGALLVAAPVTGQAEGAVYVIEGDWRSVAKISAEDADRGDFFGGSLASSGDVLVVGLLGDDGGAGTAAIFERHGTAWKQTAKLDSKPANLRAVTGEKRTCDDGSVDLFECSKVDLVSFLPVDALGGARGVLVNDLWGWTDPATGREYVLQGRTDGTAFVDITDPSNPVYVGQLPLTKGANPNVWRDIKTYKDHAFIVADGAGEHGVQVFDLTRLRSVTGMPATFDEDAVYHGINSAHNIVINEETGFAYTTGNSGGGETCGGGLHMIDIRDPENPTFAGCFSHQGTGYRGTGYTHDAQCVTYHGPDADYRNREICFSANETALSIGDVTDKSNVKYISQGTYPNSSYVHQGWLTEDHRYFYIDDEGDEVAGNVPQTRTLIWDVSDLDDPQLAKEYSWGSLASDHNLYVRGNLMYQSNYVSGLRVHDISDPVNPKEVAYFDTVPTGDNGPGFAGSWSNYPYFKSEIIAVSSMQEGLFLVKRQSQPGL